MIAALMAWSGLSRLAWEALALVAVAGGLWLWHHETFEAGVRTEVAKVVAQDKITTEIETAKAVTAETGHEQELEALREYRDSHPDGAVSLCVAAPSVQAPKAQPVSSSVVAAAPVVQLVPGGDNRVRPEPAARDIGGMLDALAARADEVSAQARELQGRDK